jgi:hypothetical protein
MAYYLSSFHASSILAALQSTLQHNPSAAHFRAFLSSMLIFCAKAVVFCIYGCLQTAISSCFSRRWNGQQEEGKVVLEQSCQSKMQKMVCFARAAAHSRLSNVIAIPFAAAQTIANAWISSAKAKQSQQ